MRPVVSVLIGAFNNAGTLDRAADSILTQTVTDLELLIVNDGSSDETEAIARRIARGDSRAEVLSLPVNAGISRSLGAGMRAAKADVVAVLDADDWAEPARLEEQLRVLEEHPEIGVVGCRMREVDEAGNELASRTRFVSGQVNEVLMRFNPIPNSAAVFRRHWALEVGGYDPRYRWAAEYDLWIRMAEHHVIYALDEILATRVMSGSNVAATREREQIAESILLRGRALARRRSLKGATGLVSPLISYATPIGLKRARRRRLNQAP